MNKYIRLYLDIQDQKRPVPKKNYRLRSRLLKEMFGINISATKLSKTASFKKIIYKKTNIDGKIVNVIRKRK